MTTLPQSQLWINRPLRKDAARLRLFCLPHAGGGASMFFPWMSQIPKDTELWPIQLPGRETRLWEAPFTDLQDLVHVLLPVLLPHLERPFAFFGHSMGALISFELARQLQRRQAPTPAHLFVAGREAPQLPLLSPPIHQLPETDFIHEIRRRYNGIPDEVLQSPELMQLLLPRLRADVTLVETYRYTSDAPLPCAITAFGWLQDTHISRPDLEAWHQQTQHSFRLHMVSGDHFFLNRTRQPFLQILSQELRQIVDTMAVPFRLPPNDHRTPERMLHTYP